MPTFAFGFEPTFRDTFATMQFWAQGLTASFVGLWISHIFLLYDGSCTASSLSPRRPFAMMAGHHTLSSDLMLKTNLAVRLRGGASDEYDFESDSDIDEYDEEEEDSEEDDFDSDEETEEEEEEEDEDEEEDSEDNDTQEEEDDDDEPVNSGPVKIILKTTLTNDALIDQSIEILASRSRTVHSLKKSVSRQFASRPPINGIALRLDGQLLDDDDVLVQELVEDLDEEEEDDEEDEDGGMMKLNIIVDMVPPVDPKFGTEMKERLDQMTNAQVFDAYIANLAAMHRNSMDAIGDDDNDSGIAGDKSDADEDEDEEEEYEPTPPKSVLMRKDILRIKEEIMASLSEHDLELLSKLDTPASPLSEDDGIAGGDILLKESLKNRRKKRKGGATMNVKKALQRNLNIVSISTLREELN